jgi:hypothetical protein
MNFQQFMRELTIPSRMQGEMNTLCHSQNTEKFLIYNPVASKKGQPEQKGQYMLQFRQGLRVSHPVTIQAKMPFTSTDKYPQPIAYFEVTVKRLQNEDFAIGLSS